MARFTKLPVTIEAVRFVEIVGEQAIFDDGEGGPFEKPPEWLVEAGAKPRNEEGALFVHFGKLGVNTKAGLVQADSGDWLVCDEDDYLEVYQPEDFARDFIPDGFLPKPPETFEADLASCINRWSVENGSNTPDFILAQFVIGVLRAFGVTVEKREEWHGRPFNLISDPLAIGPGPVPIEPERVQQAIAKGETYPPLDPAPPVEETVRSLDDFRADVLRKTLIEAVRPAALIEEGVGWVKVHFATRDKSEALAKLLREAKTAAETAVSDA
jgi:hypothetical protein